MQLFLIWSLALFAFVFSEKQGSHELEKRKGKKPTGGAEPTDIPADWPKCTPPKSQKCQVQDWRKYCGCYNPWDDGHNLKDGTATACGKYAKKYNIDVCYQDCSPSGHVNTGCYSLEYNKDTADKFVYLCPVIEHEGKRVQAVSCCWGNSAKDCENVANTL